ncbi:hypothetical protein [Amphritea sp. HPY]|uniref:hypothetical protein n=1 Tax=Amphritea sp. HPY TaxID=3421652 RepID=UPI003D7D9BBD
MATLNIGRVRPVLRGAWSGATTDYVAMDWVSYNGSTYIAIQDVPTNTAPDSDPAYWEITSTKGDKGDTGDTGAQGIQGIQGIQGNIGNTGATGAIGPTPAHGWSGTQLRFEVTPGNWGTYTDLVGPQGPAGTNDYNSLVNVPASFAPSAHGHAWGDLSGVPSTFPPDAHNHDSSYVAKSTITISTAAPSGGVNGDIWFKY